MVDVFITVDTELWPFHAGGWPKKALLADKTDFSAEFAVYFDGRTEAGDFGVPYQIAELNRHGLKATYFVEPLFSLKAGSGYLRRMVTAIEGQGQEAQLHIHTEWLSEIEHPQLPKPFRQHIRQFDEADQRTLLGVAADLLQAAGAPRPCAFRAGNYGASLATLRALAANGIRFDSSHNTCYLDSTCDMPTDLPLLQPTALEGVIEYPVSFFEDYPNHRRHVQLCACSFAELRHLLLSSWREQRSALVIVMHPFELIRKTPELAPRGLALPAPVYIRRFGRLCEFLAANRDKFRTRHFRDLDATALPASRSLPVLKSNPLRTAGRMAEQALARLW